MNVSSAAIDISNLVSRLLCRGKVRDVAILDKSGGILAHSETFNLGKRDIQTILQATTAGNDGGNKNNGHPFLSMIKIPLADKVYTCMDSHGSMQDCHLIGRAEDAMFVAVTTQKYVIVGFSDLFSPGSCIYEISETGRVLRKKGH